MEDKDYKIAAIGPEGVISGFKALGVLTFSAGNSVEALELLRGIKEREYSDVAVVIIVEELLRGIPDDEYEKLTREVLPAIVTLPGSGSRGGYGEEKLKLLAEKAIGASII